MGPTINGTVKVTKSKGVETLHAKTVDEVADKMADSGEYERIFVNRSYGTATDMNVSKRRPDVIGVRKDGKVDVVEVVSKNDKPKQLEKRMEEGLQTLPKERRGKSSTVEMQAERE